MRRSLFCMAGHRKLAILFGNHTFDSRQMWKVGVFGSRFHLILDTGRSLNELVVHDGKTLAEEYYYGFTNHELQINSGRYTDGRKFKWKNSSVALREPSMVVSLLTYPYN